MHKNNKRNIIVLFVSLFLIYLSVLTACKSKTVKTSDKRIGIGIDILGYYDGSLTIRAIYKNSPAEKSRLKRYDKIIAISENNEKPLYSTIDNYRKVIKKIRSNKGKYITLLIVREKNGYRNRIKFNIRLKRDIVKIPDYYKQKKKDLQKLFKIKNRGESQKFYNELGKKYYNIYLNNKPTDFAYNALEFSFNNWANAHNNQKIIKAIDTIPLDDDIWVYIIHSITNSFYIDDSISNKHLKLLDDIQKRLLSKKGKSGILCELGFHYLESENNKKALKYYKKVIELDAEKWDVKSSKRYIYELKHLNVGQKAPLFKVKDITGNIIDLTKYRGKHVLIQFWSSSCGFSTREIEPLKKLYKKYRNKSIMFIGVCATYNKNRITKYKLPWPQIQQNRKNERIQKLYNNYSWPNYYLINKKGIITHKRFFVEKLDSILKSIL